MLPGHQHRVVGGNVLVTQIAREVTVFGRSHDWKVEKSFGVKANVALDSLHITLPLSIIYEGV